MLYPPTEPSSSIKLVGHKKPLPREESEPQDEELRPFLTIGQALQLKIEIEDDTITIFITGPCSVSDSN